MSRYLLFALALVAGIPATAQLPADHLVKWEEGQRSDQLSYRRHFLDSGFVPIDELDAGERDVRRLSLRDPYGFLPIPGVEFERKRDGKVTMRLQFQEYRTDPKTIAPTAWEEIVDGDGSMFEALQYEPAATMSSAAPPSVCHGWMALVQASRDRAGSWWQCRDSAGPKQDYVQVMLRTALATRPDCKIEEDLRWTFQKCFGEKKEFDDPNLTEAFSPLEKQLHDAPGAEALGAARMALRVPGVAIGSPEWRTARDAVRQVLKVQSSRQETVQRMSQIASGAGNASQRDKLKMQHIIRHWSDFMSKQNVNHVEILSGLAWASDPAASR